MSADNYRRFIRTEAGVRISPIRFLWLTAGYRTFNLRVAISWISSDSLCAVRLSELDCVGESLHLRNEEISMMIAPGLLRCPGDKEGESPPDQVKSCKLLSSGCRSKAKRGEVIAEVGLLQFIRSCHNAAALDLNRTDVLPFLAYLARGCGTGFSFANCRMSATKPQLWFSSKSEPGIPVKRTPFLMM